MQKKPNIHGATTALEHLVEPPDIGDKLITKHDKIELTMSVVQNGPQSLKHLCLLYTSDAADE